MIAGHLQDIAPMLTPRYAVSGKPAVQNVNSIEFIRKVGLTILNLCIQLKGIGLQE